MIKGGLFSTLRSYFGLSRELVDVEARSRAAKVRTCYFVGEKLKRILGEVVAAYERMPRGDWALPIAVAWEKANESLRATGIEPRGVHQYLVEKFAKARHPAMNARKHYQREVTRRLKARIGGFDEYIRRRFDRNWCHGRLNAELLHWEAKAMRKAKLGDTDKWPWIRFWFNGFFTGKRTAWQRRGAPIPPCCFCGNSEDDVLHFRVCPAVTAVAHKLEFISNDETEWFRHYVQGKFGRANAIEAGKPGSKWKSMVRECVSFISALYLCHNSARLRGNWGNVEAGVAAMRGALKSVTYNLKRGRHFRERRRERRSERRECPEGAETNESSTAASSSSSSEEGSGSEDRGRATIADAVQDRLSLWPREFGIFDGGIAAWPQGGGPRQRRPFALASAQEFTEALAVR